MFSASDDWVFTAAVSRYVTSATKFCVPNKKESLNITTENKRTTVISSLKSKYPIPTINFIYYMNHIIIIIMTSDDMFIITPSATTSFQTETDDFPMTVDSLDSISNKKSRMPVEICRLHRMVLNIMIWWLVRLTFFYYLITLKD